jgi:phenylalanyl-tRNA synthetase beta chain
MVQDDTSTIVLEAAIFAPERIRGTRLRLGAGTDSSSRFEKGLAADGAVVAINRAIQLLQDILPAATVNGRFHAGTLTTPRPSLSLDPQLVRRLGGVDIEPARQQALLAQLGINNSDGSTYSVPWWRHKDLEIAEDLVEEVLRQHGYEHLIEESPRMPVSVPTTLSERAAGAVIRKRLSAHGWDEVQTYVFTDPVWSERLGWAADEVVTLVNAPAADQGIMRRSLLPTLLEAVGRNRRYLNQVSCYELGRVYGVGIGDGALADEEAVLGGVHCAVGDDSPFYAARDAASAASEALGFTPSVKPMSQGDAPTGLTASRSAQVLIGKTVVGVVGEVNRELRKVVDVDERVAFFELRLGFLLASQKTSPPLQFTAPSRFQQVNREFTWLCPEALAYADVAKAMTQGAKQFFQGVELVTVYRGKGIDEGQKALSMRLHLGSTDKTLSEKDLNKVHKGVVSCVEHQTSAKLRL